MSNHIYDEELKKSSKLSWLPWVGKDYPNLPPENKILFIGESHYQGENKKDKAQYERIDITRLIVKDNGVNGNPSKSKFFDNLHRLIFDASHLKNNHNELFWDKIAFYNFIQRPMDDLKARPTIKDIEIAQDNFFEILTLLKPQVCIFLGLKAEFRMNEAIQASPFAKEQKIEWGAERIGNSWGRFGSIKNSDGEIIKLIFIRHPSSYFSPKRWSDFIAKYIPTRMAWLKSLNN